MNTHLFRWTLFLLGTAGLLLLFLATEFPDRELQEARQVLNNALEEGAPLFSPFVYAKAEGTFQAAEQEIRDQQERWMWKRDYSLAIDMLNWARIDGDQAFHATVNAKDEIKAYEMVNLKLPRHE